jgi:hypothetical protein
MEILFTVENFEEHGGSYREINSPRSLEACLRSGLDPAELYPRPKNELKSKTMTDEMLEIKYNAFERKRQGRRSAFVRHKVLKSNVF